LPVRVAGQAIITILTQPRGTGTGPRSRFLMLRPSPRSKTATRGAGLTLFAPHGHAPRRGGSSLVAARLVPAPCVGNHRRQGGAPGLPAELAPRTFAAADERYRVAGTTVAPYDGHFAVGHDPRLRDHLADGEARAGAKAEDAVPAPGFQPPQARDMGIDEIGDMHIITHAGPVPGGIIRAEDRQCRPLAVDRVEHQRDQVRFRPVEFTDLALGVGPGDVEVAEDDGVEPMAGGEI